MLKELFYLCRLLFSRIPDELEFVELKHFPFEGYGAMMWCGKLVSRPGNFIDQYTWNHEGIHLLQAKKVGSWIIYYLLYFWYWIIGLGLKDNGSYFTIPFEIEAYANQYDLDYNTTDWKRYRLKRRRKAWREHKSAWWEWIRTI